ncbi:MAG TPA: hypothetical protein VGJ54_19995, partial [Streptosporangiaceae bacterium]
DASGLRRHRPGCGASLGAMTRLIRYGVAAVLLAALPALPACTSGGHASASASPSASAMTGEQILAIARRYAQCLREHGITGVAEPRIQDGRLIGAGVPADYPDPAKLDEAFNACGPIVDALPAGVMSGPHVSAADLEKMGKFAACMRQHGLPEWPDPNGDGLFPIRGTALENALKSDQGEEAKRACQKYYDGAIKTANP